MGLWKKLFQKESKPAPREDNAAVDEIRSLLEDDTDAADLRQDFRADSASPKEVFRYIFHQLSSGQARDDLLADLVGRGFARKTADSYIGLIENTMFKGRMR